MKIVPIIIQWSLKVSRVIRQLHKKIIKQVTKFNWASSNFNKNTLTWKNKIKIYNILKNSVRQVLYVGKTKIIQQSKVPDTFIDDVLVKFRSHGLEKSKSTASSLLAECHQLKQQSSASNLFANIRRDSMVSPQYLYIPHERISEIELPQSYIVFNLKPFLFDWRDVVRSWIETVWIEKFNFRLSFFLIESEYFWIRNNPEINLHTVIFSSDWVHFSVSVILTVS